MAESHSVILEKTFEQGLSCGLYCVHTAGGHSFAQCMKSQMDKPVNKRESETRLFEKACLSLINSSARMLGDIQSRWFKFTSTSNFFKSVYICQTSSYFSNWFTDFARPISILHWALCLALFHISSTLEHF